MEASPWICHICDAKGSGESTACSRCYQVTCAAHLTHRSVYNPQSGLFELQPVCMACALNTEK
ncbi:hypothetical protein [Geothermobacter hydrogeniphilus]|uniref:Uncharacterized protein n=1 Tax=Geothermobacter hydrogeniphilus TaxID=1969733 RepID=A0A1X0YBE8_9BACT|nr:hypothetical protein [Geothermobacter hydrogeniphilus]ORJ62505.1 hypothetical protein B5V00_04265 [Geothermobacter hydrogeniphilus]